MSRLHSQNVHLLHLNSLFFRPLHFVSQIYWIALLFWTLLLTFFLIYLIFISKDVKSSAESRCLMEIFRNGMVDDCAKRTAEDCMNKCVIYLIHDLQLSYSLAGFMVFVLLIFFVWKAFRFQHQVRKESVMRTFAILSSVNITCLRSFSI